MAKATKGTAHYRGGTPDKQCSQCTMFRPPRSCTAVAGRISPKGVCDYFKRARDRAQRWYGEG